MTHDSRQELERLLTIEQAAARMACSKANLYSLIRRGLLPVVCVGSVKGYRVDPRDIDQFIRERKQTKRSRSPAMIPPRPRLKHIRL
jgi:excisionase family DNA binding protein